MGKVQLKNLAGKGHGKCCYMVFNNTMYTVKIF